MKAAEYTCTVKSFTMLTPTVFEIKFVPNTPFTFVAGQFASVIVPGAGPKGRDLRRAYSIASAPESPMIELCVKLVEGGPGTNYLYRLRPGDTFRVVAPYGDFVFKPKPSRGVCFIATGTGIAPFRSMMLSKDFVDQLPSRVLCMLGVRTEDEVLYTDAFKHIPGAEFIQAVSQPVGNWHGFNGRVTHYLNQIDGSFPWTESDYYLCGHGTMINEVKAFLTERNVPKDAIHQEIYYK